MTMTAEQRYKSIFNEYIKREGAQKLLDWLSRTDFLPRPRVQNFITLLKADWYCTVLMFLTDF